MLTSYLFSVATSLTWPLTHRNVICKLSLGEIEVAISEVCVGDAGVKAQPLMAFHKELGANIDADL